MRVANATTRVDLFDGNAPALDARALVVGYDRAVTGPFDFSVRYGQRVGLFGPNGVGKSTLLRAITGSATVHSGSLIVHARPVASQPQSLVQLGYMPWTCREQLKLLDARSQDAPSSLAEVIDTRVDRLSGGQRQLLSVWSVLSGPARLVLLDEPTIYLDPHATDTLREILQMLPANKAVVAVSHDRAFLEQTCNLLIEVKPFSAAGASQ